MLTQKVQLRVGLCLQKAYGAASDRPSCSFADCNRLDDHVQELRNNVRRAHRADRHGLELAATWLRAACLAELHSLSSLASGLKKALTAAPVVPRLRDLLAELVHLQDEFDEVRVDWDSSSLIAVTESIQLEDVYLGRFAIELHWDRLSDASSGRCFDVVALDPNPPAANDSVTHPHVRDNSLCAGDASYPLDQAVTQGRLADAFLLINSVLTHYNPRSPYVKLSDWDGATCGDCGGSGSEEEACTCAECGCARCEECISFCSFCSDSTCADCLRACAVCGEDGCCECVTRIGDEDTTLCSSCVRECPVCGEKLGRDQIDQATGLCPDCVPADPDPNEGVPNDNPDPKEAGNETLDVLSTAEAKACFFTAGVAEAPIPLSPRTN
jgi:hypothetical protein